VVKLGVTSQLFFVLITQTPLHHTKHYLKYFSPFQQAVRAGPCCGAQYGEDGVAVENIVHPLGLQFCFSTAVKHYAELSCRNIDFFLFFFP